MNATLHWDEMADGPCGRRPPRPRPKWLMAISSRPILLSWPFQTNDITWAQTSNPVSDGQQKYLQIQYLKVYDFMSHGCTMQYRQ